MRMGCRHSRERNALLWVDKVKVSVRVRVRVGVRVRVVGICADGKG